MEDAKEEREIGGEKANILTRTVVGSHSLAHSFACSLTHRYIRALSIVADKLYEFPVQCNSCQTRINIIFSNLDLSLSNSFDYHSDFCPLLYFSHTQFYTYKWQLFYYGAVVAVAITCCDADADADGNGGGGGGGDGGVGGDRSSNTVLLRILTYFIACIQLFGSGST